MRVKSITDTFRTRGVLATYAIYTDLQMSMGYALTVKNHTALDTTSISGNVNVLDVASLMITMVP